MHLAVLRGNEWFVKYSLEAMGSLWTDAQIKDLLDMQNNNKQSVADASVHNTIIKNCIYSKEGEHNLSPPPKWRFNTRIPTDHHWNRRNPLRQTRQTNGLRPGCGDTGRDKGDHGHGSECGNEENHGHVSGWGDKGGTGHSRDWRRSKSRSASRTWTWCARAERRCSGGWAKR